jgi:hypothetical protein
MDGSLDTKEEYLIYFGSLVVFELAMYALIVFKFDFKRDISVTDSQLSDDGDAAEAFRKQENRPTE